MQTILQLAQELNVSKQAIRNKINKLGLQSSLQKVGNKIMIDNNVKSIIINEFTKNKSQQINGNQTQTDLQIDLLKSQIESLRNENDFLKSQVVQLQNQNNWLVINSLPFFKRKKAIKMLQSNNNK